MTASKLRLCVRASNHMPVFTTMRPSLGRHQVRRRHPGRAPDPRRPRRSRPAPTPGRPRRSRAVAARTRSAPRDAARPSAGASLASSCVRGCGGASSFFPNDRGPSAKRQWQRAEELGFDHAWTYDHLAWRTLRDGPWFGAIPTLTAAALATTTIRLGPLVASPNFRHPVPLAKELVTLDDISGGRLTLRSSARAATAGTPTCSAVRRGRAPSAPTASSSSSSCSTRCSANQRVPHGPLLLGRRGAHLSRDVSSSPVCPFAIAATGPRGMELAARVAQTWVTTGDRTTPGPVGAQQGAAIVAEQMARLDEACARVGATRRAGAARLDRPALDAGLASAGGVRRRARPVRGGGRHRPRRALAAPDEPFAGDLATFERIFS